MYSLCIYTMWFILSHRCKKVYDGVTHAAKLYPNAYIIMILIGTLKGKLQLLLLVWVPYKEFSKTFLYRFILLLTLLIWCLMLSLLIKQTLKILWLIFVINQPDLSTFFIFFNWFEVNMSPYTIRILPCSLLVAFRLPFISISGLVFTPENLSAVL